jgi:hypothetical protein
MDSTACFFCDQPWAEVRKSFEHIWPEWLHGHAKVAPGKIKRSLGMLHDADTQEFVEHPLTTTTSNASLLNLRTREVCRPCNGGWMSRAQEAAKPLFLTLSEAAQENTNVVFARSAARNVAFWAQMTAVTNELTSDRPLVSNAAMGQRLRSGKLLRGSTVWAARNVADFELGMAQGQMDVSNTPIVRPSDPFRRVLLTAIVYHFLTLLVFIPDSPGRQVAPVFRIDLWSRIWPVSGSTFEYPPMLAIDGPELTATLAEPGRWIPPVRFTGVRRHLATP